MKRDRAGGTPGELHCAWRPSGESYGPSGRGREGWKEGKREGGGRGKRKSPEME